jgi:hypothetical protein
MSDESIILKQFSKLIDNLKAEDGPLELDTRSLSTNERSVIHKYCEKNGVYTRSVKSGYGKVVTVSRAPIPIEINDHYVALFVKHMNIPLSYCTLDTIDEALITLDMLGGDDGYHAKWKQFKRELEDGVDIQNEIMVARNGVSDLIKKDPEYQKLVKDPPVLDRGTRSKTKLYTMVNVGKRFVSIDVRKGNFTVLKLRCPELCDGTWYDMVRRFTSSESVIASKRMREIIFGNLGFSKLANSLQEHEIEQVYQYLCETDLVKQNKMRLHSKVGDELIFEIGDTSDEEIQSVMRSYKKDIFHVRVFELRQYGNLPFFYKIHTDDSIEPRLVPKRYILQSIKFLKGMECTELDLTSTDDMGQVYIYKKSIFG